MKPLVSILIPAYNAERTVSCTIHSALTQTWPRKEVIVIDDGSTDSTAALARKFGSKITLISTENRGLCAALNHAYQVSKGDYIQELDADDLMLPDKIERQLESLRPGDSKRLLLSSPWAPFLYRTRGARFTRNSLCEDLSPVDWLLRKMNENLHMQNATWLVSRELAEAAGPWNTDLQFDQDGEYFARVLVASEGTRFVPGTGIFYRTSGMSSISFIGNSEKKKKSLLTSLKLNIQYIRSLEDSERVRKACLVYLQNWFFYVYPEMPALVSEMQNLAAQLRGSLKEPDLRWKYSWMRPLFGWRAAKWAQMTLPQLRASLKRTYEGTLWNISESRHCCACPECLRTRDHSLVPGA
jgi:glycosyltransferase involved in cell wall biosynthesis